LSAAHDVPPKLPERVPQTDLGVTQLPNKKLAWLLDAKFGLFIHWGLYAGPAHGEWHMENDGILPEVYRRYAFPDAGNEYFDAAGYNPESWAHLAKDAGMKWMCLTARHHEGFCLFDSPYPNAFSSMQTLHRDLFGEYVKACRGSGLKVGMYYSPICWRYPGYYDWTGTHCLPNHFGYATEPAHFTDARVMKEENYVNVRKLLTSYGRIDHIFWDGGWLGQQGSDADAAFFNEPGRFLDPNNRWPISRQYQDFDAATGKPLGIMGMVRKYQPDAIANPRYGWKGDILEEEGEGDVKGPIRSREIYEKCLSIHGGGWGYNADAIARGDVMARDTIIDFLANCVVRDMVLLANVGPDRHGVIPPLEQARLREVGEWLQKVGDAVYGTRAGPWQPVDDQYGYCYKGSTVFVHLLKGYVGTDFKMPPLGNFRVVKIYEVYSGNNLPYEQREGIEIHGVNRSLSPCDSVIGVEFDRAVQSVWN
jgi:alpha-L-fucosidase